MRFNFIFILVTSSSLFIGCKPHNETLNKSNNSQSIINVSISNKNIERYKTLPICDKNTDNNGEACRHNPAVMNICSATESISIPKYDLPTEQDKITLKNCDAITYYYGLDGYSINYTAARKCALLNIEKFTDPSNEMFSDQEILAMIYANGYKVNHTIKLATKFLCSTLDDTDDIALENLIQNLQVDQYNNDFRFDICDKADDPNTINPNTITRCNEWLTMKTNQSDRIGNTNFILMKLPKVQQDSFNKLYIAEESYITAYINSAEVDLSMYEDRVTYTTTDAMEYEFYERFNSAMQNKLPTYSDIEFNDLDKKLNQIYLHALESKEERIKLTIEGIKQTQRLWIAYREAWVNFMQLHSSNINKNSIRAWITIDKIKDLNSLSDFGYGSDVTTGI